MIIGSFESFPSYSLYAMTNERVNKVNKMSKLKIKRTEELTYHSGSVEGLCQAGNLLLVAFTVVLELFNSSPKDVDFSLVLGKLLVLSLDGFTILSTGCPNVFKSARNIFQLVSIIKYHFFHNVSDSSNVHKVHDIISRNRRRLASV